MTTLEDVYNALGSEAPFDSLTGDLSDNGLAARQHLEQLLVCLDDLGVIGGWSQDVLDQLEGMSV